MKDYSLNASPMDMIRLDAGNTPDTRTEELVADIDTLDAWRVVLFNDDEHTPGQHRPRRDCAQN